MVPARAANQPVREIYFRDDRRKRILDGRLRVERLFLGDDHVHTFHYNPGP
jgi:hypothetical protein